MIRIEPAGAEALLLTLAEEPEVDLSVRLAELARRLRGGLGEGVRDLVPGWTTLMLHYDPYRIAPQVLEERLGPLLAEWHAWRPAEDAGRLHEIPVWYAGEDLATVAVACGLTGEGVIELHSAAEYRVGAIGFAPGFAYLGGLDPRLVLPRRATPRARVPAGSLA
ncbi:carboxyltransferase domain-containing protein, partial [Pseudomonas aeruginosa]|nr:carboxyltransferase domain-containing protein [Pseudomonas aeruginosa]